MKMKKGVLSLAVKFVTGVMESSQLTYDDIFQHLQEMTYDFKHVERILGKSIESCHHQETDIGSSS